MTKNPLKSDWHALYMMIRYEFLYSHRHNFHLSIDVFSIETGNLGHPFLASRVMNHDLVVDKGVAHSFISLDTNLCCAGWRWVINMFWLFSWKNIIYFLTFLDIQSCIDDFKANIHEQKVTKLYSMELSYPEMSKKFKISPHFHGTSIICVFVKDFESSY